MINRMLLNDLHDTVSAVQSEPKPSFQIGRLEKSARFSYGRARSGNRLICGDNMPVLTRLCSSYARKIRCIYIDPPYNNRESYTHYHDDLDHETWLRDIVTRVQMLRGFLRPDGSIWISIDDSEVHYLKVALDQIFGRQNFVSTIIWQQRTTRENRNVFSNNHEYILVYAIDKAKFAKSRNLVELSEKVRRRYKNPDGDPNGDWQSVSANVQAGHAVPSQFYDIESPSGVRHSPPPGRCWVYNESKMRREIASNRVWFGRNGKGVPRLKKYLAEAKPGLTPETLWRADEVGTNDLAKKHLLRLFPDKPVFDTPKPESLIHRILTIATDPKDLVLDAYLGSGTTAAVAHKMGRRYIGIERGEHAMTYCAERLRQVIEGEEGGISETQAWKGGGGFDFFHYLT